MDYLEEQTKNLEPFIGKTISQIRVNWNFIEITFGDGSTLEMGARGPAGRSLIYAGHIQKKIEGSLGEAHNDE